MNQNISNSEILHSGLTIFRRDRSDRVGGGVLIAIKTASFKAVKEFKPESEAELQQLEIIKLPKTEKIFFLVIYLYTLVIVLFISVTIGQSNYFGFGFTTLN